MEYFMMWSKILLKIILALRRQLQLWKRWIQAQSNSVATIHLAEVLMEGVTQNDIVI